MEALSLLSFTDVNLAKLKRVSLPGALSVLVPLLAILLRRAYRANTIKGRKPPGPKGLPFIKNLLQVPSPSGTVQPWRVYNQWREKYGEYLRLFCTQFCNVSSLLSTGDMVYLEAAGQKLLILNSLSAIDTLLNKRATNYSDRISSAIMDL
jgi:hypothetical protein